MDVILKDRIVTVRKPHDCFGCLRIIRAGEKASYKVVVLDDYFHCYYICEDCEDWLRLHPDCFVESGYFRGEIAMVRAEELAELREGGLL